MTEEQRQYIEDYKKNRMERASRFYPPESRAIFRAEVSGKYVALTFDCCYACRRREAVKKLLFLRLYHAHPTFFVTGHFIKTSPKTVKLLRLFHFDIENHSVSHHSFLDISPEEQQCEILDNAKAIEKETGKFPVFFRFPYGDYGPYAVRLVKSLGMLPILWNIDTKDWKPESADEEIYNAIMKHINPGSIILCHIIGNGFEGLKRAVADLEKQGYRFVTVNKLLELEKRGE